MGAVDRVWVEAARNGDELAFARLVSSLGDRLYSIAFHVLRDVGQAEDATQQALIQIWRELPRLRQVDRFETWAYRIVTREALAEVRRRSRWIPGPAMRLLSAEERSTPDSSSVLAERDWLLRGLDRLSADHRAVLVLKHYADLADDEIAEALGVPTGTVRSRLHYSMRALRAALDAEERFGEGRSPA